MPARPELDVEALLARLVERGVDFVIVGGIAAVLHGSARNTFDLDICYSTAPENLEALGQVLVELEAQFAGIEEPVPFVPDARTLRAAQLLTLDTPQGGLDVMATPDGAPRYDTLRKRAQRYEVGDLTVLVASIDDLLAMKRAAGRAKDLSDIEELEAIKRLRRRA